MNTQKFLEIIPNYLNYLNNIGYSKFIITTNISVINRFKTYCLGNNLKTIDWEVIEKFRINELNGDNLKTTYKRVVKRVLKGLFDYATIGKIKYVYNSIHVEEIKTSNYQNVLNDYINSVLKKSYISDESKKRKKRTIIRFLNYLTDNNINDISQLTEENVVNYLYIINTKFNKKTLGTYVGILKEFTKYLYDNKLNSNYIIQNLTIYDRNRKTTPDCFNEQELQQILNSIDINESNGKFKYIIMLLLITYGLRIGDILNLKFENINFEKNTINIVQSKTKKELSLYLTNQVKLALLDYAKNERPNDIDSSYIFITISRPYRPYAFSNLDTKIINNIIIKSNVNIKNKILGTRIFRHSLATNMINRNVSVSHIQSLLGHQIPTTTAKYITRDVSKLALLTLEVSNYE